MKINTRKIKGRMDVHSRENQSIKLIRRVYIPVSSDSLKRTACQILYFSALTIFTTMRRKFVKKKTASFACTHGLAWTGWAYRSRERQRSSCMKLSGGRVGCQGRTTGLDATCDDLDLRGSSRAGVTSSPSSIATAFLSVRFLRRISWISRPNSLLTIFETSHFHSLSLSLSLQTPFSRSSTSFVSRVTTIHRRASSDIPHSWFTSVCFIVSCRQC